MKRLIVLLSVVLVSCNPASEPATDPAPDTGLTQSERLDFEQIPLSQAGDLPPTDAMDDPLAGELAGERQTQLSLPMVRSRTWDTLRTTRIAIDEQSQLYTAAHSTEVRAMAGRRVTLRGYMLPLEMSDRTTHFLISPYTPVCFFHPPAEPNEVVEVRTDRPIEAGYHLVEVTGTLQLANDGEKGLFFVLDQSRAWVVERVG
jgi:hypothetical protein